MDLCIKWFVIVESKLRNCRGEFGVGSILSIAVALIVSAFVLVPGMKKFASSIMVGMADWWDKTISNQIFPTS